MSNDVIRENTTVLETNSKKHGNMDDWEGHSLGRCYLDSVIQGVNFRERICMESTEASRLPSFDEDLFWVKGEKCSEIHGKKNNKPSLALSYYHIAMI